MARYFNRNIRIKTVIIVQARMGSIRFPGKMMAELGDFPLLDWVLRRVKRTIGVDSIVLATTDLARDNILTDLAINVGIEVFRGKEDDVLSRFSAAADKYEADQVVRVCADNPFTDPGEVERLIRFFNDNPCDYACNHQNKLGSGYADGFGAEIFSNDLLQKNFKTATDKRHCEHVTSYIWDHAENFHICAVEAPPDIAFPDFRFDVDTPNDLKYLNELFRAGVDIDTSAKDIIKIAKTKVRSSLVNDISNS